MQVDGSTSSVPTMAASKIAVKNKRFVIYQKIFIFFIIF